ncbi:hypothetical protein ABZY68_28015 [Streptomyces sp. NPDC006482]|uniref:hypothetical protein n=1 Tax=Streptomyces sp. NPDC006482 TaxID=3154306 RepID=UPI0033B707C0
MSHQDNSVFVDASGRRGRLVRWGAAGVGVACLGFLGIVVAGSFGAGPAGGPLPWADDDRQDAPALIQPDPAVSGDADSEGAPKGTGTPRATAEATGAPATTPTPTTEATTSAPSPSASATAVPTTPRPTATSGGGGTGGGGGETTDTGPGKADEAPGATKRPK